MRKIRIKNGRRSKSQRIHYRRLVLDILDDLQEDLSERYDEEEEDNTAKLRIKAKHMEQSMGWPL